jgi:hypothetical protein
LLLTLLKPKLRQATSLFFSRYGTRSAVSVIQSQAMELNFVKREKWREAEIDTLPQGEHDYFERKSGQLFDDMGELLSKLAKTISAMANSGGGHIILGVDNEGLPDGVPPVKGDTPMSDWLEQKIPRLVEYPLSDFRVHVVEPSTPSRIPQGRQVIVIDIGDSALAPHQCGHGGRGAQKYVYYHRQAGHSEPAPHFYIELLRQRLVAPSLKAVLKELVPLKAAPVEGGIFISTHLRYVVTNTGRVAAYKWQLQIVEMEGHQGERIGDYRFSSREYPAGFGGSGGIRIDDTILPGCSLEEDTSLGVLLRPEGFDNESVRREIDAMISPVKLGVRLATEVSPGQVDYAELSAGTDANKLVQFVLDSTAAPSS